MNVSWFRKNNLCGDSQAFGFLRPPFAIDGPEIETKRSLHDTERGVRSRRAPPTNARVHISQHYVAALHIPASRFLRGAERIKLKRIALGIQWIARLPCTNGLYWYSQRPIFGEYSSVKFAEGWITQIAAAARLDAPKPSPLAQERSMSVPPSTIAQSDRPSQRARTSSACYTTFVKVA
jgi:hypothetical protein